jgi:predicted PurR-regulated permease PerM
MVWGTLWGVVGMFLCVPIMVVGLIVLSQFETTRPLAVLMSADGRIPEARP